MNLLEQLTAVLAGFEGHSKDLAVSAGHAEEAVVAAIDLCRQANLTAYHQLESSLVDILRSHAAKARALQEAAANGTPPMPVAMPQSVSAAALGDALSNPEFASSEEKEPAQ